VIRPPLEMGKFEFVAIAALRAAQLTRGCRPRVDGDHTTAVLAQREVAEGKVNATNGKAELPVLSDEPID
jgi:DNA-directed RNA polymerase subunit K/omega